MTEHQLLDLANVWTIMAAITSLLLATQLLWAARKENGITCALAYREFSIFLVFLWSVLFLLDVFPTRFFHLAARNVVLINFVISQFALWSTLIKLWAEDKRR